METTSTTDQISQQLILNKGIVSNGDDPDVEIANRPLSADQVNSLHIAGNFLTIPSSTKQYEIDKPDAHGEVANAVLTAGPVNDLHIINNSVTVAPSTVKQYDRIIASWRKWLVERKHLRAEEDPFGDILSPRTPVFIISWLMERCDSSNPDGTQKPSTQQRSSFSYAQKMRAALAYAYRKSLNRGEAWTRIPNSDQYEGDPTKSPQLQHYMIALKRRKHNAGEKPISSRALTAGDIDKIYRILENSKGQENELLMTLIHTTVTIAFTCLMRIDEVLNLQFNNIHADQHTLTITLKQRKTAQLGGIKPFVLYQLPNKERSICPMRALARWLTIANFDSSQNYIFPSVRKGGICSSRDAPINQSTWLKHFRGLLDRIELFSGYYGGHSCRRGGAQWLARVRKWPIHRICDWGGWSLDHSFATILRYLFSWNDNPLEAREDFMRPDGDDACIYHGL